MARLTLVTSSTTTTSPPTSASDGKPLFMGDPLQAIGEGFDSQNLEDLIALVFSTAGSGVMTCSVRLWGYYLPSNIWVPWGITPVGGTDTNRGLLNNGVTIGEFAAPADLLRFAQPVGYCRHFSRAAAEIFAIAGTATAVSVVLEAKT